MEQERRQNERYPFPDQSNVIEAHIVWSSAAEFDPHDVSFIDVSRAGVGIVSHNVFIVGDSLKIRINLEKYDPPVEIVAVVCNRRPVDTQTEGGDEKDRLTRYGLYFEFDSDLGDAHCEEVLTHLEEEVKRLHFLPV